MKVILLADLRHLGRRGTEVVVKSGYGRNYLLPQGLALLSSPGNRKVFEQQRKRIDATLAKEREAAALVATEISGIKLRIAKRVGATETLYGSVTASEIADLLADKGIIVDRRRIDLQGGIKSLGDHLVHIDLHPEVIAELTVAVEAAE